MNDLDQGFDPLAQQPDNGTDLASATMAYGLPPNATIAQRRTWQRQERFLDSYRQLGSVAAACAETGIPVATVESWDHKDTQGYKKRKEDAGIVALGVLEREIHRRGVEGVERDVYYKGEVVGKERLYSDNLLMFRAKRLDPAYKDNYREPEPTPNRVTQINIHLHPNVKLPDPDQ